MARPFNHIGPGQDARFVVASFARQLAGIAAGGPPIMHVGNLEAERDFLDVRDVAAAYVLLVANGRAGEVYNICSGRTVAIREVLRQLITIARVPVEIRDDPERMRPSDLPILSGDATKLRAETGWEPRIPLAASLRDIYDGARGAHERIDESTSSSSRAAANCWPCRPSRWPRSASPARFRSPSGCRWRLPAKRFARGPSATPA